MNVVKQFVNINKLNNQVQEVLQKFIKFKILNLEKNMLQKQFQNKNFLNKTLKQKFFFKQNFISNNFQKITNPQKHRQTKCLHFNGIMQQSNYEMQNTQQPELSKRRSRLMEFQVRSYILQLVAGLKYLHKNKIIHRDLKLGNIFLNYKLEIKIGDFGLSTKHKQGQRRFTICGTPNYIAPQILDEKRGHSYEVDIWALGIIIYTLLIGKPPFQTQSVQGTYKKIKNLDFNFPKNIPISNQAKDLIKRILVTQPLKRPTLDQILKHDFLDSKKHKIPMFLPTYTVSIPPQGNYVRNYVPEGQIIKVFNLPNRIRENNNVSNQNLKGVKSQQNLKSNYFNLTTKDVNGKQNYPNFKQINISKQAQKRIQIIKVKNLISRAKSLDLLQNGKEFFHYPVIDILKWNIGQGQYKYDWLLTGKICGVAFEDGSKLWGRGKTIMFYSSNKKNNNIKKIVKQSDKNQIRQKLNIWENVCKKLIGEDANNLPDLQTHQERVFLKKIQNRKDFKIFSLSNKSIILKFNDRFLRLYDQYKKIQYVTKRENIKCRIQQIYTKNNQQLHSDVNLLKNLLQKK